MVLGLPAPSLGSEIPSKRTAPVQEEVSSTVTILSGVRLNWSSPSPERIVLSDFSNRADVSRTQVVSAKTQQVVHYVDFI